MITGHIRHTFYPCTICNIIDSRTAVSVHTNFHHPIRTRSSRPNTQIDQYHTSHTRLGSECIIGLSWRNTHRSTSSKYYHRTCDRRDRRLHQILTHKLNLCWVCSLGNTTHIRVCWCCIFCIRQELLCTAFRRWRNSRRNILDRFHLWIYDSGYRLLR